MGYRPSNAHAVEQEPLPVIFVFTPYRARYYNEEGNVEELAGSQCLETSTVVSHCCHPAGVDPAVQRIIDLRVLHRRAADPERRNGPDERLWDELAIRLGPEAAANITRGPALEKSIAPLRSYVFAPLCHGSLMLCGDSPHIVPPTGAKGLNLAASDVHYAAEALARFFTANDADAIPACSDKALSRVWKSERFSWSLTRLMHRFPYDGPFQRAMQVAELDYIATSQDDRTRPWCARTGPVSGPLHSG